MIKFPRFLFFMVLFFPVSILFGNNAMALIADFDPPKIELVTLKDQVSEPEREAFLKEFRKTLAESMHGDSLKYLNFCSKFLSLAQAKVEAHNGRDFSLTAYLSIGLVLSSCQIHLFHDKAKWEKVVDSALRVFQNLAKNHPNSWQGMYASIYSRDYLLCTVKIDHELRVKVFSSIIPTLKKLESEPNFRKFWRYAIGFNDVAYVQAYEVLIDNHLELGDFSKAKTLFEELKGNRNVPSTSLKRIESQIKAYTDYKK